MEEQIEKYRLTDEEMADVNGDKEACLAVIEAFDTCDGCSASCRAVANAQIRKVLTEQGKSVEGLREDIAKMFWFTVYDGLPFQKYRGDYTSENKFYEKCFEKADQILALISPMIGQVIAGEKEAAAFNLKFVQEVYEEKIEQAKKEERENYQQHMKGFPHSLYPITEYCLCSAWNCEWYEPCDKPPDEKRFPIGWCKRFEPDPDAGYVMANKLPPCVVWAVKWQDLSGKGGE